MRKMKLFILLVLLFILPVQVSDSEIQSVKELTGEDYHCPKSDAAERENHRWRI